MPNPQLTSTQRAELFEPLFDQTILEMERLSNGDPDVLWALRRKLAKELTYLERGSPQIRGALKKKKMREQDGKCAICHQSLPEKGAELDRSNARDGYTSANTRLVHHGCHVADQMRKNYK